MKQKANEFVASIENFSSISDSERVVFFSYFHTEILRKPEITTKDLKLLYEITDLPTPQNYGGEIKQLLKTKKLIKTKNGYKLSRYAKEWVISQIKNSKGISKKSTLTVNLSFNSLHPVVIKVCKKLYNDSHYAQAIFEAYKAVVNQVKNISGIKNLDGKPLMEKVFSLNSPIIKFNDLQSQSDKDEQIGLMLLFSGAALGIRNPKAHENIVQKSPLRTLEYLNFASLLLKRLDERIK